MPDVRIVNVTKKFGKIVAVDNVNLHVYDKEYFSLLGPSGCGKTTLLRLIAGLINPAMSLSKVVFPHPLGPSNEKYSLS